VCIENIERGGARLLRTVEEILNFSSIQAGTFPVNPAVLSVDQEVGLIVNDFIAHAREKGLSLEFRSGCNGVNIVADSYAFGQALSNLLDNAIKFTHTGQVTVLSARCDQSILVEVWDTGVGIAEEYLPRLFDSFSQEHSGKSRPFEGLGLGMALTKRYVEMCDGRIEVDSEKGKGSRFTMVFPAAEPSSS
jgi:signal transduction histidine kinase